MCGLLDVLYVFDDWEVFVVSWNDFVLDIYLVVQGWYCQCWYVMFIIDVEGVLQCVLYQLYFQSLEYNLLQGNIQCWFWLIYLVIVDGFSFCGILCFSQFLFGVFVFEVWVWYVEMYQFWIEVKVGEVGEFILEGWYCDGVDYVLVLMIDWQNIESGIIIIYVVDGELLGSFILVYLLDVVLVDDVCVCYGVILVILFDLDLLVYCDVLVVMFCCVDLVV